MVPLPYPRHQFYLKPLPHRWLRHKESACQCRRHRFDPWVRKLPRRKAWQPTPVFLPGESHGQRSPAGHSPRGSEESDTTERLTLPHLLYPPFKLSRLLGPKSRSSITLLQPLFRDCWQAAWGPRESRRETTASVCSRYPKLLKYAREGNTASLCR